MKLKFGEQLIEPAVRRLHALRRHRFRQLRNSALGNVRTILPGVPAERTHVLVRVGVQGRDDFAQPLVERNLTQIRLNFMCFCLTKWPRYGDFELMMQY